MRTASLSRMNDAWEATLVSDFTLISLANAPSATDSQQRILVLSVSAGNGHVRAADALVAHARADYPKLSVRHHDVMQLVPGWFRRVYSDLYMKLASGLPEAWGWLYRKTDQEAPHSISARLRRLLQRLCTQRLLAEVERFAPDAIVCTHFLPAEILGAALKEKRIACPVWVQVTDFDLHQMWVNDGVSGYFVANDELAYRLYAQGVPPARVIVSGIPVMPGFITPPDRKAAAERIGLDASRMTVLMMSGGAGTGLQQELVKSLLAAHPELQIIVLTGRNDVLRRALQGIELFYPTRLRAIGFTDDVHQLMACADLAITKPGGLSTSECLTMGLPMLLVNPIPGQEERNAAWLLQEGVAVRADDPATLQFRLHKLLSDREKLSCMRACALALAKPHAAHDLLQRLA